MFTGLIEAVGEVASLVETRGGYRLQIGTPLAASLAAGESVSVNGVCLTVTPAGDGTMHAEIGPETARITTLGTLRPGQRVNLERALRADGRFGGHFVQGHVDAVGTVVELRGEGDARWIGFEFPGELAPYFVRKGSVAVDGISLTVAELAANRFDVMIVPFTWAHTNLAALHVGSRVNLECDLVGKYVARSVEMFRSA
jgi:riboflavin synthase